LLERISRKWSNWQRRRRSVQETPHLELSRLGVIDYFRSYPRKAIAPQWDDLHGIYLLTMARKPRVILELGGGYSTFVFAHATRELTLAGHDVALWSVDESQYWQNVVRSRLPPILLPYVRFSFSEPHMIEVDGENVARFDDLPVESCNFLYVDGGLPDGHKRAAGSDAYFLERNAPDDYAILVDGRLATCDFLKRKLRNKYVIGTNHYGAQTLFARAR
jgi:hypothetical protein